MNSFLSTFLISFLIVTRLGFTSPVSASPDVGVAMGVVGLESESKSMVIRLMNEYPHFYFGITNNPHFAVEVIELIVGTDQSGEQIFINPQNNKIAAVATVPNLNDFGTVIGVRVFLPPSGVLFRANTGHTLTPEDMTVHELRHAHQFSLGQFGMDTDIPDMVAAENDAQKIENRHTGLDLDYYTDKHGADESFYDDNGDIRQGTEGLHTGS
jgi:hypothetical protein